MTAAKKKEALSQEKRENYFTEGDWPEEYEVEDYKNYGDGERKYREEIKIRNLKKALYNWEE